MKLSPMMKARGAKMKREYTLLDKRRLRSAASERDTPQFTRMRRHDYWIYTGIGGMALSRIEQHHIDNWFDESRDLRKRARMIGLHGIRLQWCEWSGQIDAES